MRPPSAAFAAVRRPRSWSSAWLGKRRPDVAKDIERGVVIGCDTVAECCGQILGKPRDRETPARC